MDIISVYRIIDLTGVFINGILGGAIARRRKFDAIGFGLLAILSGLGGGLLRDTFLQHGLPAALKEPIYFGVALSGGLVAMTVSLEREQWNKLLKIGDGIVLGVWAVTGTIKALNAGLLWPSAMLLGMITAVGGGMIRDITIGVVPAIFGGNTLYATSALLGSGMMVLFNNFQLQTVGMVVSASFASILSIVAYFKGWGLPNNPDWAPVTMTAGQLRRLMLTRAMVEHDERLARKQRRKLRRRKDDGGSHSSI